MDIEGKHGMNITDKQLEWCAQHDWFLGWNENGVIVDTSYQSIDGYITETQTFNDFAVIRQVTGY
tara:strand:+ start:931 stop:1125 length:195 start_codon:yes stop_codon:yes gene_type:complete